MGGMDVAGRGRGNQTSTLDPKLIPSIFLSLRSPRRTTNCCHCIFSHPRRTAVDFSLVSLHLLVRSQLHHHPDRKCHHKTINSTAKQ
ncbi:hypothetical protein L2E82_40315 [Cichorium intybus]|uniref:Uncharacterized protein n=1 Tax=Cichorium intybus TaxID=13427 RepID=A0ACB9AL07_CICIN|nr:hypothetical protein L2E82_40315 [Cichorium intybus]